MSHGARAFHSSMGRSSGSRCRRSRLLVSAGLIATLTIVPLTGCASAAGPRFVDLRCRDEQAAVDWLSQAFALAPCLEVRCADNTLAHAELRLGDSILMVDSDADEAPWAGERQATCIFVAEPDVHYANAVRGGATIVRSPADTSYGARAYVARDPEGFVWTFSTYRPALAEGRVS